MSKYAKPAHKRAAWALGSALTLGAEADWWVFAALINRPLTDQETTALAYFALMAMDEQAKYLGLPTAPAKTTDRRSFVGETVQCEAIALDVLSDVLRHAIEGRRDQWTDDDVLRAQAEMRAELLAKLGEDE